MKISPWILMALGVVFVAFIVGAFITWLLVGRSYWVPKPADTFLVQTSGPLDTSSPTDLGDGEFTWRGVPARPPDVYILAAATLTPDTVDELHARGAKVICEVPLVQWHPNETDAGSPAWAYVTGPPAGGGAVWLDIRPDDPGYQRLRGLITLQFENCGQMHVDGVIGDTADIVGAHVSVGARPVTGADLESYLASLVPIAHSIGLSIGQTDLPTLTPALARSFDFAVVHDCFSRGTCAATVPYAAAHKAIFEIETTALPARFCPAAAAGGRSAGRYSPALNGRLRIPCA